MWGASSFAPLSLGALTRSSFIQDTAGSCLCRPPLQPQAKPWHASHRGQGGSEHPPHTPTVPRAGPWGPAVWELTYLVSLDKSVLGDLGLQGKHLVGNVALQ